MALDDSVNNNNNYYIQIGNYSVDRKTNGQQSPGENKLHTPVGDLKGNSNILFFPFP